jgi:hypothetical protein
MQNEFESCSPRKIGQRNQRMALENANDCDIGGIEVNDFDFAIQG